MTGHALYIGIGKYQNADALPACARAAKALEAALRYDDDDLEKTRPRWVGQTGGSVLLTSDVMPPVTEDDMKQAFTGLLTSARGGNLLLYFAGHARVGKFDGSIGRGKDLLLAAYDDDPKGTPRGLLASFIFSEIAKKRVKSATIILDCCYAGKAAEKNLPPNTVLLAAAGADQQALSWPGGRDSYPQFTQFLLNGIKGPAGDVRGWVTALSLYSFAAGGMNPQGSLQVPVFKGQVSGLPVLHRVKGSLSAIDLKLLAREQTVRIGDADVTLEPAFFGETQKVQAKGDWEETEGNSVKPSRSRSPLYQTLKEEEKSPEQRRMDYYNRLRKAGLVKTTDGKDLFWTVIASVDDPRGDHGVCLTPLGQYYYKLSKADKLFDEDS